MRQKIVLMKILKKLWGDATDPTLQRGFQYANSTQKHLKANISEPSVWGGNGIQGLEKIHFLRLIKQRLGRLEQKQVLSLTRRLNARLHIQGNHFPNAANTQINNHRTLDSSRTHAFPHASFFLDIFINKRIPTQN